MHHSRLAVLVAAAALVLPGVAHAAPVCNLLTDPAGDVRISVPQYGPMPYVEPSLDIRSVDVVSDAQGIGVTLRLGSVGTASTSATHTGLGLPHTHYYVFLTIESVRRELGFHVVAPADNAYGVAYDAATGGQWSFEVGGYRNDAFNTYDDEVFAGFGAAKGVVDSAKSEIRVSASWADLKKNGFTRARRDRAVKIRARAMDWWLSNSRKGDALDPEATRYRSAPRDDATTAGTYVLGAKTCTAKA